MNRRGVLALITAAVTLVTGAVVVVLLRHDDQPEQIKTGLLDGVRPNPDCPVGTAGPSLGAGRTRINIARVSAGCLVYSSEVVPDGEVEGRLADLRADPEVAAADRAVVYRPDSGTGQAGQKRQWPLEDRHLNGGAVRDLWPAGAAEVKVAVIDTGIDDRNPDLRGQVVEKAPWAKVYEDGGHKDHGSHVAGIIAATDDADGVVGLAPRARLIDVQYWNERSEKTHGREWAGPINDLGGYITWSVNHGADVINMSLSGSYSDTTAVAMSYAERAGVAVVAAAGNCGVRSDDCPVANPIGWPAAAETGLSVANHNRDDHRSKTSTANSTVDIAAPGEDIVSSCLIGGKLNRRRTCTKTGTSMATPYVAAAVALLRARRPSASPAAIREAIVRTARPAAGQQPGQRNDEFGYGLLEPVDAARYLDQHPGDPGAGPSTPRTDPVVAAYVSSPIHKREPGSVLPPPTGVVRLATAGGRSIPVKGVKVGENEPRLAFSPGGPYAAAVDGAHLTLVDLDTGDQRTVTCECNGIAFDSAGQAVTADRDSLHRYDPATGRQTRDTVVKIDPQELANQDHRTEVVGMAKDRMLVRISNDLAGSQAFLYAVEDDGDVIRFGGPRAPGARLAVSPDGSKVAYGPVTNGCEETGGIECQQYGTALAVADLDDLSDGGPKLSRVYAPGGASGAGLLSDLFFDGDQLVAGWSAARGGAQQDPEDQTYGPTDLLQTAIPSDRNPGGRPPSTIAWTSRGQGRAYLRNLSTGEQLYGTDVRRKDPSQGWRMRLWFVPDAGRGKPVKLADDVLEVVPRLR